jgi:dolichol-phosphate mannosyltransferase
VYRTLRRILRARGTSEGFPTLKVFPDGRPSLAPGPPRKWATHAYLPVTVYSTGRPMMPSGESSLPTGSLTVLLPVYNEANSIEPVLRELRDQVAQPYHARFLVCEDGSTDGTPAVLTRLAPELGFALESHPGRRGYADAVRNGLGLANSPVVFFTDSDGQYDPADFARLWKEIGTQDMVIGRKVERGESFYRIVLSRGFHILIKAFTGVPLEDMDCGFRLIRKDVITAVLPEVRSLHYSFWAEFSILAYRRGFRILEVPVSHRARLQGGSSIYTWNRLPRILILQVLGLLRLARRLNRTAPVSRVQSPREAARD